MAGFVFIAVLIIVIAKIIDFVLINHAYDIAKELGENPPASGLIFGFVEDFFWQRILEISDHNQSKLMKRYLFYHRMMIIVMALSGAAAFIFVAMQYSK